MIFFTAMALGIFAGLLRSAFVIALVAMLIGIDFMLASLVSTGNVSFASLGYAIAGYNSGLIGLLLSAYVAERLRPQTA